MHLHDLIIDLPDMENEPTIVTQFVSDIRNDTNLPPAFFDGLKAQEVMEATSISVEEERWIALPLANYWMSPGENRTVTLPNWARMIRMRAVDIVQPDICYVGGLSRALEVAQLAESAGVPCIPHSANLSLVTVFSLHMMGD